VDTPRGGRCAETSALRRLEQDDPRGAARRLGALAAGQAPDAPPLCRGRVRVPGRRPFSRRI